MATINVKQVLKKIENSKGNENLAYGTALRKFNSVRPSLIGEFQNHPVTQELENGPESANLTNTLPEGNLFSFIGFTKGENPVDKLYKLIFNIKLNKSSFKSKNNNVINYEFKVNLPTDEEIEKITPMPNRWSSASWVKKIETTISGLEYYLYGFGRKFRNSFSGTGLQIKHKLRSNQYKGIRYLSEIFENFEKKLKK